jgi:peptide/nickel transport system substrate-binding protein
MFLGNVFAARSRDVPPRARVVRRSAWVAWVAGSVVMALSVAGCASGGSASGATSSTLTMQWQNSPTSLDPALDNSQLYGTFSYDPLIYLAGDSSVVPGLATSWKYVDDSAKIFELKIREGVTFQDGSELTAEAVAGSMNRFLKAKGPNVNLIGPIHSVTATDKMTVQVSYSVPYPDAALDMSQVRGIGLIVSPKGVADPGSLKTTSHGTGQFIYDDSASVADNTYVFDKNPKYWNPKAQHFDKIIVKPMSDPNQVLSALRTGQIDFAQGDPSTMKAANEGGLKVTSVPGLARKLVLADRGGTLVTALADPRVRQAFGYAIDRKTLAATVGNGVATPVYQLLLPGSEGHVDGIDYTYDPDHARKLLAEAGYPNGFSMRVITSSLLGDPGAALAQAVAGQLKEVGITLDLQVESAQINEFVTAARSQKYPAIIWLNYVNSMVPMLNQLMPTADGQVSTVNPFLSRDKELQTLRDQAYATVDNAKRQALYEQMSKRLAELAWAIPIMAPPVSAYTTDKVTNVQIPAVFPFPFPVSPDAAYGLKPTK